MTYSDPPVVPAAPSANDFRVSASSPSPRQRLELRAIRLGRQAVAALALCSLSACRAEPASEPELDGRTGLRLPAEAALAVRAEMRTMLGSLHDIHRALAAGDTALARQAAAASGLAAAADPALEPLLPEGFLRLGVATHAQFDSLALAVRAGASRDTALARLSRITANCVSCHATYRLAPPPD